MLARRLLARDGLALGADQSPALDEIVLLDQNLQRAPIDDSRVRCVEGQITDRQLIERTLAPGVDALFHLAAVVSAGAEQDFAQGMHVNLDGLRTVLDACRRPGSGTRVVFPSSVAAFGGELPAVVLDTTAATPQSSYGTQKVMGELLVSDMTRKGFIDGRSLRLPTIVVRPGKPNLAASGFMSNILREPLAGEPATCPVSAQTCMWILSPQRAVDVLIHAMELPAARWGWNRTLNAPGITVSVEQALEALEMVAGPRARALVRFERDPAIERIVLSWPARFETTRATQLGFQADGGIETIIRAHVQAS
jgi:nucleoside-diphosphate-sugar epimerase